MSTQARRYFIYAAESLMSFRDREWRLTSSVSGWEERDVPINSVPFDLRVPGTPAWVIWDARHDRLSQVLPRARLDPSDLPGHWAREYKEQQNLLRQGQLDLEKPDWLDSDPDPPEEDEIAWDPIPPSPSPSDFRQVEVAVVFGIAGPKKGEVLGMKRFVPSLRDMATPEVFRLLKGKQRYPLGSFPWYLAREMIAEATAFDLNIQASEPDA